MGDTTIIRPDDFIGPAQDISSLVREILGHSNLHHLSHEAKDSYAAIIVARDALDALVDLLNGQ